MTNALVGLRPIEYIVMGYNPGREGVRMGVQLTDGIRLLD